MRTVQAAQRPAAPRRRDEGQDVGSNRRHKPDYILLLLVLSLLAIGIIVVYSISPALAASSSDSSQYVVRQLVAVGLGLGLFFLAARVPLSSWRKFHVPLLVAAALATLLALILPLNEQYPAHRWIRFAGFSFQSVELVKFALLLWLAGFLAYRAERGMLADTKMTLRPFLFVLVGLGIVVAALQSDLGSAVVIAAMMIVMAFVAGVPMKRLALVCCIIAVGGLLLVSTSEYRRDRFATFVNPQADCSSTGYQACQALIAVGSGGMIGLGLGNSVQAYGYLPEAENDSIFAIYAEKFGFVGGVVLIALLLGLYARLKRIADRAPDNFSRLVVVGVLVWLSTQAIINIGAMVGLLPLKGITLPLISYGGSSVLMVLLALGLVFQISRYTSLQTMRQVNGGRYEDDSPYGRRIRGSHYTPPRSRG